MRRELEYVLEISESWRKQSFFIFSSFKGSKLRMLYKPMYNFMLLLIVCFHSYMGEMMETKGLCIGITLIVMLLYLIAFRPYRCTITNLFAIFTTAHILVVAAFGYVKATGLRHGLLV
jgi:hypothetical protein